MEDYLSEEEIDTLEFRLLVEWLETVPTAEWHAFAHNWSYDNADDILHWLIDNPRTEKATALMIYWMAGAGFFKQYATAAEARAVGASVEKDWNFIQKIEANYLSGFYTAGTVGFDPAHDNFPSFGGYNWTAKYQDQKKALEIPTQMLEAVPGIQPHSEVTATSIEGIPAHIWAQLEPHFGD